MAGGAREAAISRDEWQVQRLRKSHVRSIVGGHVLANRPHARGEPLDGVTSDPIAGEQPQGGAPDFIIESLLEPLAA